ncbi:SDR family NAD(P)-dependent oxidoreductase [Clostridium sp. BJN0001]|uniref:SDR family NAD(P)-dependent oxidoreductase n=1 Tax=Clostridium sp. BJN0001 TaxID=2930219 RepID=UPI001FD26A6F|nr:SDR family NAD(P)-dependent oxidoreductase [Clostridium sp. BJN0001]
MNSTNKRVLLTGGAGFIGSNIAEGYLRDGYEVIIVDNLSSGSLNNIKHLLDNENLTFCNVDIRDFGRLDEVFERYRPDIINHHAAQKSVIYSVENPRYDLSINIIGFLNLLDLAHKYDVKRIITVSSGGALSKEIIGDEKSKETDMPQLISPYSIDKFLAEKYINIYAEKYDFQYNVLRYANVYGPRQIADGECGVIPIFLDNIYNNKQSILMTYDDMPRGCTRDYVYVDDIVNSNLLATEKFTNEVINIGSGEEVSILDIYDEIVNVFDVEPNIIVKGPRKGDVKRSVLDSSKAKELLGWEINIKLEEGLTKLREYIEADK